MLLLLLLLHNYPCLFSFILINILPSLLTPSQIPVGKSDFIVCFIYPGKSNLFCLLLWIFGNVCSDCECINELYSFKFFLSAICNSYLNITNSSWKPSFKLYVFSTSYIAEFNTFLIFCCGGISDIYNTCTLSIDALNSYHVTNPSS